MTETDQSDDPRRSHAPGSEIRTFLIADVRGYTLFTQERGDEAAGKLAAKFADIARDGVQSRGGTLLELRGDEALSVFSSPRDAIRAAVELQERFVEATLDQPELPLTVGIGLDAGEAVPVEGGYRGGALNLAARLCGEARAGEILASKEVAHLARRVEGVRYVDRGTMSFKGLSEPLGFVRVMPEGVDPVERLRPFAPAPSPRPGARRRRWTVGIPIAVALALIAIWIPLLRSGDSLEDAGTNSIALVDGESGDLELAADLGQRPGASAVGFGSLWVAEPDRGVVARLDLEDGSITDTIRVGNSPSSVAVGVGSVWVANEGDGTVSRINTETNEVSQTIDAGSGPSAIAVGDGALWVADAIGAELLRVDPTSGETQAVPLAGSPAGVAFTPNGVWVSIAPAGLVRVDPESLSVTLSQTVGSEPTAVLSAFGSIWVANHVDASVTRLEPSTGRVESTISVGAGPNALGASESILWVANEFDGSLTAINPETNAPDETVPVGGAAASLTAADDGLWLAVGASATEHRGGALAIASLDPGPPTLDPALVYDARGWSILSITNDGLVAYKKVGGPAGTTLVPDLASALPQISADGLSYRFPLRDGIKYSTGEPVRPEDFRRGIERALALSPDAANIFNAIDGAEACHERPTTCDLSESVLVDAEAVTIRLSRPDPDMPFKLGLPFTFPVPVDTPTEDQGLTPVPSTGPYMIESASTSHIELVRNPEFREWAAAAQPDGFVDSISWRFGLDLADSYDRLSAGDLDWMADVPQPDDLAALQATHPDQVILSPTTSTYYVGFDVLKPPFDDMRVRQALSYAIDRDHVVDLLGGPTSQRKTCQILPPNFQGYEPFCPYTLNPESRVWSAPDLDRAGELIAQADVDGQQVTVWTGKVGLPAGAKEVMAYVTEVLDDLGMRATLKEIESDEEYFGNIFDSPAGSDEHPQVFFSGWISDYPRAGDFIDVLFRCDSGHNAQGFCDRDLDAAMDEAHALQSTDPGASNRAWIAIEHQLVEEAVWAPLSNPVSAYAFSERVGNVQVHPQWGTLLSRLWVR